MALKLGRKCLLLRVFGVILILAVIGTGCAGMERPRQPLQTAPRTGAGTPETLEQKPAIVEEPAQVVPFRTLVQRDDRYIGVATLPTLFLSDDPTSFEEFLERHGPLQPEEKKALRKVNTDNELILGVMLGRFGSGGYAISIRDITVRPGAFNIRVQIDTPEPGRMQTTALTNPIHVVAIPRSAAYKAWDGASQVTWTVTDMQGNRLLEVAARRW